MWSPEDDEEEEDVLDGLEDLGRASSAWAHKDFTSLFTRQSSKILKSNMFYKGWFNSVMYLAPGTAADQWLRTTAPIKGDKKGDAAIFRAQHALRPGDENLVGDMCPMKTGGEHTGGGCFGRHGENCIFTTGQLSMKSGQLAMYKRTVFLKKYPEEFRALMYHEIKVLQEFARKGAGLKFVTRGGIEHLGRPTSSVNKLNPTGAYMLDIGTEEDPKLIPVRRDELRNGPSRKLALRLNGTSDLLWEKETPRHFGRYDHRDIFTDFHDVTFYDYTKFHSRFFRKHAIEWDKNNKPIGYSYSPAPTLPPNYSLTFSYSGTNADDAAHVLETGGNVAVVVNIRPTKGRIHMAPMVKELFGWPVIDGDFHDLRFKDDAGEIVGLRAKGQLINAVNAGTDEDFAVHIPYSPEYVENGLKFHDSHKLYPYGPMDKRLLPLVAGGEQLAGLGRPGKFGTTSYLQVGPVRGQDTEKNVPADDAEGGESV